MAATATVTLGTPTAPDTQSGGVLTWTAPSMGAAQGDRIIQAVILCYSGSAFQATPTSCLIGGVTASLRINTVSTDTTFTQGALFTYTALVPTNGTTSVVLTLAPSDTVQSAMVLHRIVGSDITATPTTSSATATGSKTVAASLAIAASGVGIGVAAFHNQTDSGSGYAWTNLTELSDAIDALGDNRFSSASSTSAGTSSRSTVVTTTASAANCYQCLSLVAYPNAIPPIKKLITPNQAIQRASYF